MERKAVNFDLDTNKMKDMSLYPQGYSMLRRSFKELGFTHRQGSGYISDMELNDLQVSILIDQVVDQNPWLEQCVKVIDVTDIGKKLDYTDSVRNRSYRLAEQARRAEQAERKNTKEKLTAEDEAVIERIRRSKRGGEFEALWRGDSVTGDRSRDEFKMFNMLSWFCDQNREQMQRIYKHSPLYRPELGQEYLDRCTDKILKIYERPAPSSGAFRSNSRGNGGYKGK